MNPFWEGVRDAAMSSTVGGMIGGALFSLTGIAIANGRYLDAALCSSIALAAISMAFLREVGG